jgi:hypothetical protein
VMRILAEKSLISSAVSVLSAVNCIFINALTKYK